MEDGIVIRPRIKPMIYIFGVLFFIIILANTLSGEWSWRPIFLVLFISIILVGIFVFVVRQKIILYPDYFLYNDGWKKTKITWSSIVEVEIVFQGNMMEPKLKIGVSDGNIDFIRISFYSRKNIQLLGKELILKSQIRTYPETLHKIIDGKFPWYL